MRPPAALTTNKLEATIGFGADDDRIVETAVGLDRVSQKLEQLISAGR